VSIKVEVKKSPKALGQKSVGSDANITLDGGREEGNRAPTDQNLGGIERMKGKEDASVFRGNARGTLTPNIIQNSSGKKGRGPVETRLGKNQRKNIGNRTWLGRGQGCE